MKKVIILLCFFLSLTACQGKVKVIDSSRNELYHVSIVSDRSSTNYGNRLIIETLDHHEDERRRYESDFTGLKPWKVDLADVDGDGNEEILVAVQKTTHFDKEEKNRLFVFNFNGEILTKKWTGSQIAGRWKYFYADDWIGRINGDELIFIEHEDDFGDRLHIYYWFDFGFQLLASSDWYDEIVDVAYIGDNYMQIRVKEGKRVYTRSFHVKDGHILERK